MHSRTDQCIRVPYVFMTILLVFYIPFSCEDVGGFVYYQKL